MARLDLPEEVRRRVALQGGEGAVWVASLPSLIERLERAWGFEAGPTLTGGSGALVLEATAANGRAAVLKLSAPWLDEDGRQAYVLRAAEGRGYAELLAHDEESGALLLERLGAPLSSLGLDVQAQTLAICAALREAWATRAPKGPLLAGDRKAAGLATFIERVWEEQGRPCSRRVIDAAVSAAERRRAAFDPDRAVVGHGDAHAGNLLLASGEEEPRRFKFVDPEGLFIEPAYDLSGIMRDWGEELLAGDPLALGRRRCEVLAGLTSADPTAIWEWGLIERVSTGLHLRELGWAAEARTYLAVAEAWAAPE